MLACSFFVHKAGVVLNAERALFTPLMGHSAGGCPCPPPDPRISADSSASTHSDWPAATAAWSGVQPRCGSKGRGDAKLSSSDSAELGMKAEVEVQVFTRVMTSSRCSVCGAPRLGRRRRRRRGGAPAGTARGRPRRRDARGALRSAAEKRAQGNNITTPPDRSSPHTRAGSRCDARASPRARLGLGVYVSAQRSRQQRHARAAPGRRRRRERRAALRVPLLPLLCENCSRASAQTGCGRDRQQRLEGQGVAGGGCEERRGETRGVLGRRSGGVHAK